MTMLDKIKLFFKRPKAKAKAGPPKVVLAMEKKMAEGGELLHGFLAELHDSPNPEVKNYVSLLSAKWNVHFREGK